MGFIDIFFGLLIIDCARELTTGEMFTLRDERDYFPNRHEFVAVGNPSRVVIDSTATPVPIKAIVPSCSYCGSTRGSDPDHGWCMDCKGV